MTAIGVQVVDHFWEGIAILVLLGIWIGAAAMWQYLGRPPLLRRAIEETEEEGLDGVRQE